MASEKVTMILKSKTELPDDHIAGLSDGEAWQLVYALNPSKSRRSKQTTQICFTGFSPSEKERLEMVGFLDDHKRFILVPRSCP